MIEKIIKVRCINNGGCRSLLTINKIYEVINYKRNYYKILCNDLGLSDGFYQKNKFMTLAEYRNQQIDNILK